MGRIAKREKKLNILASVSTDSLKSEKVTGMMECMVGHDPL